LWYWSNIFQNIVGSLKFSPLGDVRIDISIFIDMIKMHNQRSSVKIFKRIYLAISRDLFAETVGTFILVFVGTGAVIVNQISQGAITHLGISIVFGAIVTALIYTLGHISGAHFNPAVTLAFWQSGFFPGKRVMPYILAQCAGAIAASILLRSTFGMVGNLGATLPLKDNWLQALILETVLTFILMFVIFGSGLDRRAPIGFAGIAIGLTVAVEAAVMGLITGASMNPARSLAPALVSGLWQHHWVYWVAPILGAQLAGSAYRWLSNDFQDCVRDIQ
jgi:MIP family channel proteins